MYCDPGSDFKVDLTDSYGPSCTPCGINEREEYIQYSEQELPGLVQEELDAKGCVGPEQRDLLISVMKHCQKKLRGMFEMKETSGAGPVWEESKILNDGLEDPSVPTSQFRRNSTSSLDVFLGCRDSWYDSALRGSNSISHSRGESNLPVNRSSSQSALASELPFDSSQLSASEELELIFREDYDPLFLDF
jgi:hypothetical protein